MDRPLRFCMITTFYSPFTFGGDGIFVHRLSNELARQGHHVEVIHCKDSYRLLAGRDPAKPYNDHPNVTVHGLKSPFGLLSPLATQQTGAPFFKMARIQQILEGGFDVIHYHNITLVGGPKLLEYGQGIKLYTMHDYWLVCPTHVLFRFNRAPCRRPYCFLCTLVHKRPPQWWRYYGLLKRAVKHVDAFIGLTRFCIDMHNHMGFNLPMVHLPHFLPARNVAPSESAQLIDEEPAKPYFLYVGRLEKIKGLQQLIPIFLRYHKARLLIAGAGSWESRLRRLARGSADVRFLGHLSDVQLQLLYRQAVAVIVPSICFDIFPLVIVEAMAQQTPAIVKNMGGMPEAIEESGGGFVYDTEEELVAAMDRLLADPSCRRRLGLSGYQAYQRRWTGKAYLNGYFDLIRRIAATRSGSPLHKNKIAIKNRGF